MTRDEEIQQALMPFAILGAECFDGKTTFNINLQYGDDQLATITQEDFIRAFQMYAKLSVPREEPVPTVPQDKPTMVNLVTISIVSGILAAALITLIT